MISSSHIDAVVVSNYGTTDSARITSGDATAVVELSMDGTLCTFDFLDAYFKSHKDLDAARARMAAKPLSTKMPTFLNGVYLADVLRKTLGLSVRTINNFSLEQDRLAFLLSLGPRVVIVSTSLIIAPQHINEITTFVRERAPDTTIIVGGTKIYKSHKIKALYEAGSLPDFPEEQLARVHYFFGPQKDQADYYIVNTRGEHTLLEVVSRLMRGRDVRDIKNVAWYTDPETCHVNPLTEEPNILKDWCIDWSAVEDDVIGYELPVTVKQGCPFRCNFCDFIALDRKLASRSLDTVFKELHAIKERFGDKAVYFVDDNLFFRKEHVQEFCRRLMDEKLDVRWRGLCRAGTIDEDNAMRLRDSGCYNMSMGIESGDDTVLENMNKKISARRNHDAICRLNAVGIDTDCTFVVGFPGETESTLQNTIELLNSLPREGGAFNFYHAFPFILAPLARVATREMRERFKLTGGQNVWRHPTMNARQAAEGVVKMFREVKHALCRYTGSSETTTLRNSNPNHQTILQTRQEIAQGRIRGMSRADEQVLWDRMEDAFRELSGRDVCCRAGSDG